jgi:acylphosphatase
MSDKKAFTADIRGRVQGVGFRYSAYNRAKRLGLTGWIKNERDGSVHVECEGQADKVEQFEKWLKKGPPGAQVRDTDFRYKEAQDMYPAFTIEY